MATLLLVARAVARITFSRLGVSIGAIVAFVAYASQIVALLW